MSWDIALIKTRTNVEPIEKIDETNFVPFVLTEVATALKETLSNIYCETDEWLYYEGDTYAISFNLAVNQHIMLHVHILDEPEDAVLNVIEMLCNLFDCRAFDTTSVEFIKVKLDCEMY